MIRHLSLSTRRCRTCPGLYSMLRVSQHPPVSSPLPTFSNTRNDSFECYTPAGWVALEAIFLGAAGIFLAVDVYLAPAIRLDRRQHCSTGLSQAIHNRSQNVFDRATVLSLDEPRRQEMVYCS